MTPISEVLLAALAGAAAFLQDPSRPASAPAASRPADTRFAQPPGLDTPAIAASIEALEEQVKKGTLSISDALCDARWIALHERPSFRAVIREHAPTGAVAYAAKDEPGTRLTVHGRLLAADGKPAAGHLVYAYQTDARGWYADRGAHYRANSGDVRHARLFAYVKTDAEGRFVLRTIRPAGYPETDLPQHIHVHFSAGDQELLVSEVLFEDDPRLTPPNRVTAQREGCPIALTRGTAEGGEACNAEFRLPEAGKR